MAHAGGRPTTIDVNDVIDKLNIYINENEEPFIQEFCLNYDISKARFYDLAGTNQELSDAIKKAIMKQELYIVKNASKSKINPVFGMFRLKQPTFGYTDKTEIDQTIKGEIKVNISDMSDEELDQKLAELAGTE